MDILVGGDVCFGRWFKKDYISYATPSCLDILSTISRDYFICNLECNLSDAHGLRDMPKGTTLAGHTKDVQHLISAQVDFVTLANNHALDLQLKGLQDTTHTLSENNISWGGVFDRRAHIDHTRELILISTNFIIDASDREDLYTPEVITTHEKFLPLFLSLRNKYPTYKIFVLPHWGYEYSTRATSGQVRLARKWIDLGADAVVGAHAHVIQSEEIYKGKPILYGQGNLYFLHKNWKYYYNSDTHESRVSLLTFEGRDFKGLRHTPLWIENDRVALTH
jgi:poly-gamma-glutamate synthesis protein (capsule biosynthesis protein)